MHPSLSRLPLLAIAGKLFNVIRLRLLIRLKAKLFFSASFPLWGGVKTNFSNFIRVWMMRITSQSGEHSVCQPMANNGSPFKAKVTFLLSAFAPPHASCRCNNLCSLSIFTTFARSWDVFAAPTLNKFALSSGLNFALVSHPSGELKITFLEYILILLDGFS